MIFIQVDKKLKNNNLKFNFSFTFHCLITLARPLGKSTRQLSPTRTKLEYLQNTGDIQTLLRRGTIFKLHLNFGVWSFDQYLAIS